MNCVLIIFLASLAINSASSSSDLSENSNSPSRQNNTTEELGTCPMNSSISVKVFRNLKGEWHTTFVARNTLRDLSRTMDLNLEKEVLECGDSRIITISGSLKDTEPDNSTEATVGDCRNNTDGEANDSFKRMKTVEDRMTSFENTLITMNGTLSIVKESHANVENTLKSMEQTISQMNTMLKSVPGYGSNTLFDTVYKGRNVRFSFNSRTAWRTSDRYAGVVSNSVLEDDQVFQIRIEERIEKFTEHGIGIGVIQEKQNKIKDANYIFLNRDIKGTWSIYSASYSQSGKSNTYKDGDRITENGYPLPTNNHPVGTILGVSRRSNGNVHFFINGVDKGAAFTNVPKDVYAFVDIIHYVTKISIVN